jgi:hypothetical protein
MSPSAVNSSASMPESSYASFSAAITCSRRVATSTLDSLV